MADRETLEQWRETLLLHADVEAVYNVHNANSGQSKIVMFRSVSGKTKTRGLRRVLQECGVAADLLPQYSYKRTCVVCEEEFETSFPSKKWCYKTECRVAARAQNREGRQYGYGITFLEFADMKEKQQGLCKICGKKKKLVVDHDHLTGRVRGLLCINCNSCLGWFERRSESATAYLASEALR